MAEPGTKFVFYEYHPSMVAAIVFIAGFTLSAIYHLFLVFRLRSWYFIPFVLGCIFEAVGFAGRALSSNEYPDVTKMPYIMQSTTLLLGPTLFAASIYMVLGRLIMLLGADSYSMIRPKWLTKVFVLGDVLSFFAQGGGAGILTQAKTRDEVRRGENIIIGGLGIQILFFGFFMVVTFSFHMRISKNPTPVSLTVTRPWRTLLAVLYLSSALIMVRSVFRVAEYVLGSDGELKSKEIYLYLLDATPMVLVALMYNIVHPGRTICRDPYSKCDSTTSLDALERRNPGAYAESQPIRTYFSEQQSHR
ncbi:Protein RTA1 [Paramyrothecium foliicola]|nr:Protein RTA1 [Paramyrothecium foliicola]